MTHPFNSSSNFCPGPTTRRGFMRMGLAGFASLSLPEILRMKAAAADEKKQTPRKNTAVIMVWQPGGCSHIDTYDPKPHAPSEYSGPFSTIPTAVPGMHFTELLPMQAKIADKFTVLRSMRQTAAGHPAGSMQLLSGDQDKRDKPKPKYPDWMSVAHYLRSMQGPRTNPLPGYIGVNPPAKYNGPAYLGDSYSPFAIVGDPANQTSLCQISD